GNALAAADGYVIAPGDITARLRRAHHVLVAGSDGSEATHRLALSIGAAAVVHADMMPDELAVVWAAVRARHYPIPSDIAQFMAVRLDQPPEDLMLADQDMTILVGLARGDTMAEVANQLGCSVRHARRHAHSLWNKLGVANRAQGLVVATRWGFLGRPVFSHTGVASHTSVDDGSVASHSS
ncbi:MAG: LuxR C-terminal-related transcriptional regulator, partial [Acidimicrobiia bacterium]